MRACVNALALAALFVANVGCAPGASDPDARYVAGPDSKPQSGVPRGRVFAFEFDRSRIYPGTSRLITVYVPAQYRADKPACVHVGFDTIAASMGSAVLDVPVVFDNLIAKGDMPVTIAIGISAGTVRSERAPASPRFNRSLEFDSLNGDLARFLLEELFPEVERRKTPDGRPIRLSQNPNDRSAAGFSTGAIAAFTLAWERPDAFRRVFTAIGTFVGMRGGDRYPVLVRKTEPKPIRIFMQDGSNDQWPGGPEVGDWWMSNQTMERALKFAGYEVEHVWGEGTHDPRHLIAVYPDAMRWLWKGWPQPVTAGPSQNTFLKEILLSGEPWQPVAGNDAVASSVIAESRRHRAIGPNGIEYIAEPASGTVWLVRAKGEKQLIDSGLRSPSAIALSPDGLWLAVAESETHWGYSYQIQPDGTVRHKQRFYWFHVADEDEDSGASAWVPDRAGRLYTGTRMGVQVFDRNGRVRAILPLPESKEAVALGFGGDALDVLYVSAADGTLYRRKLKVAGVKPGSAPIELPPWGPG
jgi:enterochelin esterase-like enzyme